MLLISAPAARQNWNLPRTNSPARLEVLDRDIMPSNHCHLRLGFVLAALVAVPHLATAQQYAPRRAPATAPSQQRPAPQQRPAAAAPRVTQGTAQPSPRTAQAGPPAGQYPVRQTAGSEPLPQRTAAAQPVATPTPVPAHEPFRLTPEQQALLDQILLKWEQQSSRVNTFSCTFGRWEVDETYGPAENHFQISEAYGEIKYKSPDHGVYQVTKQTEWDGSKKAYVPRTEGLDHWVCNGEAIFEFNYQQRQLIERQLAPEMRGKAITDGPLPFVFGTKADQLKARYWMRDITPTDDVGQKVWLEAWPKYQRDAANFQHAIIILNQKTFMPSALRIIQPDGKNKQDYAFQNISVNNPLAVLMSAFSAPLKPLGWTKVVIPAGGPPASPTEPAQAQQPRAQTQR